MRPLPLVATLTAVGALACAGVPGTSAPEKPAAPAAEAPAFPLATNPTLATSRRAPGGETDTAVPGRYVVKLKRGGKLGADGRFARGGQLDASLQRAGVKRARALSRTGREDGLYAVDATADEATFQSLVAGPDVEWAEPVWNYRLTSFNDPYAKYQWNMDELRLESVHGRAQGKGVIVAVVDSGVTVGTDGPANVLPGYDIFEDDNDPSDTAALTQSPSGSHGTHVAGTIAQITNNGIGVVGIAPQASILPVRVGDYRSVSSENIAAGITWAVDHGANVINLSVGGSKRSRAVEDACAYAYEHGVVVVAATGNDGYDGKVSYPAAYPNVIAVGAHDSSFRETSYSNHGKELALLAPGGDTRQDGNHDGQPDGILQGTITSKGWGYAMMEGTSMASPHVAGAAAVLISAGIRGPDAVRAALVGGARQVGDLKVLDILGALDYRGAVTTVASPATTTEPSHTAARTAESASGARRAVRPAGANGGGGGGAPAAGGARAAHGKRPGDR